MCLLLYHDNAHSHTSLCVREFLAKHNVGMLPQPPHSPDLAPADLSIVSEIKTPLKGYHFESIEIIKAVVTAAINEVPFKRPLKERTKRGRDYVRKIYRCSWRVLWRLLLLCTGIANKSFKNAFNVFWDATCNFKKSIFRLSIHALCGIVFLLLLVEISK